MCVFNSKNEKMAESNVERQIIEELEHPWDQTTQEETAKLERDIKKWIQTKETKKNLWQLRRDTFFERKWKNIYYKLDNVNNYIKEVSISNSKIKETLLSNNRKTIVMAVQIALYKAWYLQVWQIDWQRWPITRGAVAKFQKENWLWKQKNPWYLNVNTLNKLIEVSADKEEEKKQKKKIEKKSPRMQINIPFSDNKIVEQPDKTRVAKKSIWLKKGTVDLKRTIPQKEPDKKEKEKKWWTMEEVRLDITQKVWDFREWHNWDFRFAFHNSERNPNGDLPDQITICGETYKYNWEWNDLNWLWFETYDGGWAFQLWTYVNGILEEWFRFYFDWEREVGKFDYVWDLKNGIRIEADWSQHKVQNL